MLKSSRGSQFVNGSVQLDLKIVFSGLFRSRALEGHHRRHLCGTCVQNYSHKDITCQNNATTLQVVVVIFHPEGWPIVSTQYSFTTVWCPFLRAGFKTSWFSWQTYDNVVKPTIMF